LPKLEQLNTFSAAFRHCYDLAAAHNKSAACRGAEENGKKQAETGESG